MPDIRKAGFEVVIPNGSGEESWSIDGNKVRAWLEENVKGYFLLDYICEDEMTFRVYFTDSVDWMLFKAEVGGTPVG